MNLSQRSGWYFYNYCFRCFFKVLSSMMGKINWNSLKIKALKMYNISILLKFMFVLMTHYPILVLKYSLIKGKESENSYHELKRSKMPSLSCVHKHLLSFDWERLLCQLKYLDTVSVCLCVPVLLWSLQFLVRMLLFCPSWSCTIICINLHYNMYYFHFTLQEPC